MLRMVIIKFKKNKGTCFPLILHIRNATSSARARINFVYVSSVKFKSFFYRIFQNQYKKATITKNLARDSFYFYIVSVTIYLYCRFSFAYCISPYLWPIFSYYCWTCVTEPYFCPFYGIMRR
jgi:hypothetical protein